MINNFELIKPLLNFDSEDEFYFLNIMKRKKEHPELGNNSYVVKHYFIKSVEQLEKSRDEIIAITSLLDGRAYINLNRRSFESMAFHTLKKITDQIMNKDYQSVKKAYTSVCGNHSVEPKKRWIVDIDNKNYEEVNECIKVIEDMPPLGETKLQAVVPTKHGYHIICSPFNRQKYTQYAIPYDIQTNNPTILFTL